MELWVSPKECANLPSLPKHRLVIYVAKSRDGKTALEQVSKVVQLNTMRTLYLFSEAALLLRQGEIETSLGYFLKSPAHAGSP